MRRWTEAQVRKQESTLRAQAAGSLLRLRTDSGWTQVKTARFLGLPTATFAGYESGARPVPTAVLLRACDVWDVPLEDLIDGMA